MEKGIRVAAIFLCFLPCTKDRGAAKVPLEMATKQDSGSTLRVSAGSLIYTCTRLLLYVYVVL